MPDLLGKRATRWLALCTALVLIAGVTLGVTNAAFAQGPPWERGGPPGWARGGPFAFDDLDEASWAKGYMTMLAAKGIFKGRGRGKMAPQAAVNRAEVLTAVVRMRLLAEGSVTMDGEGDSPTADEYVRQAYEADTGFAFGFNDAAVITRGAARWSAPYIYMAIQLDIIENEGSLRPQAAAHRAWVAEVLMRGLADFIEVDADEGTVSFTDTGNLSARVVDYIERAVRAGLFQGYPDGSFGPGRPLTRAELMTLLGRADERNGLTRARDIYRGRITEITMDDGTVAVITVALRDDDDEPEEDDDSVTFLVDEETRVFVKGDEVTLDHLQVGDRVHVKAYEDDDGILTATVIWATFEQWELDGTVVALSTEADDDDAYSITVEVNEIEEPDEGELPLDVEAGDTATFTLADYARLRIRGQRLDYDPARLMPGDLVELKFHGALVIEVVLEERPESEITGTVTDVDADDGEVTIRVLENDPENPVETDDDGLFTFEVDEDTRIRLRGEEATLADIAVGDLLEVKIQGRVVTRVVIETPEEDEEDEEDEDDDDDDDDEEDDEGDEDDEEEEGE